jgi:hypothetical protein
MMMMMMMMMMIIIIIIIHAHKTLLLGMDYHCNRLLG